VTGCGAGTIWWSEESVTNLRQGMLPVGVHGLLSWGSEETPCRPFGGRVVSGCWDIGPEVSLLITPVGSLAPAGSLCGCSDIDGVVALDLLGLTRCLRRDLFRGDMRCVSASWLADPVRTSSCCRFKDSLSTVTPDGAPSSLEGVSEVCPAIFKVNLCDLGSTSFAPIFNLMRGISG
jgi:hypothetical protein